MKASKIFYIISIVLVLIILVNQYINKIKIDSCNRVSIATITGGAGSFSTGRSLLYTYKYSDNEFRGSDGDGIKDYNTFRDFSIYKDKKYFVKFSCEKPNISKLCWDIPVPDTLQFIPSNGWDKIPYGLNNK